MKTLLEAQLSVVNLGIWLAGISFAMFVIFGIFSFYLEFRKSWKTIVDTVSDADATNQNPKKFIDGLDVPGLITAASGLTDSLAKAGPSLWAMIASILFLAIAASASGAYSASDDATKSKVGTAAECKADPTKCGLAGGKNGNETPKPKTTPPVGHENLRVQ